MQTYENQTLSKARFRFVAGKVRANFFRCHKTKTPLLMGFLVYELNCLHNNPYFFFGEFINEKLYFKIFHLIRFKFTTVKYVIFLHLTTGETLSRQGDLFQNNNNFFSGHFSRFRIIIGNFCVVNQKCYVIML
jgi:hypothetical protein